MCIFQANMYSRSDTNVLGNHRMEHPPPSHVFIPAASMMQPVQLVHLYPPNAPLVVPRLAVPMVPPPRPPPLPTPPPPLTVNLLPLTTEGKNCRIMTVTTLHADHIV